jgi:hypothetical protein
VSEKQYFITCELSPQQMEQAIRQREGVKPKFHKGIYSKKHDYWTCGNCGATLSHDVCSNWCFNCGYYVKWDSCRCLTGIHDGEEVN